MYTDKIKSFVKITETIFGDNLPEPQQANLQCIDDIVTLDCEGVFNMLVIKFVGNVYIYNELPDGYIITISKDTIRIVNKLGKFLNNNLLFKFGGEFNPKKATLYTFKNNKVIANIFNKNEIELIAQNKTKIEDDSILLLEEGEDDRNDRMSRNTYTNKIDDDSVKGLYTTKPFKDGYTGYYNYFPSEGVYMSGKKPTNESKPLSKRLKGYSSKKSKKSLNSILSKVAKNVVIKQVKSKPSERIVKDIKPKPAPITKQATRKERTIKKGGSY